MEYVLHHTHRPGLCHEVSEAWDALDAPAALSGHDFYSYCRSGDHGGFVLVEAESPEAALALLPALMRPTTRVYAGERLRIGGSSSPKRMTAGPPTESNGLQSE